MSDNRVISDLLICMKGRMLLNASVNVGHLWCSCLGLNLSLFSKSILFIIQKKAIRIISFSDLKSHSESNCSNFSTYLSSMMSLNYRYSLLFISGHTDCYPPPCFSEYFKFTYFVHSYSTRQLRKRYLYLVNF